MLACALFARYTPHRKQQVLICELYFVDVLICELYFVDIASASVDVVRGGVEVVWCGGCVEVVTGL